MSTSTSAAVSYPINWDLDRLFPNPSTPEFQAVVQEFRTRLQALAESSRSLPAVDTAHAAAWAEFLDELSFIESRTSDLHAHVGCHAAADAANADYQRWEADLAGFDPLRQEVLTNYELALRDADEADLDTLAAAHEKILDVLPFVKESRQKAELRLPREQELLANELAVDGLHAWGRLYDRVSGALRIPVMERGEIVHKSPGQVMYNSPERQVRINEFHAADKAWGSLTDVCSEALNHISGSRLTVQRQLGLQDHLEIPLRLNRMTRQTLETMWAVVSERKSCLSDYFTAKSKLLNIDKPYWYDVAAPLPDEPGRSLGKISYDDACETICKAFGEFSGELGDFGSMALRESWIEAENRGGKRQGGFCTGFPTAHETRIFMTFTDSLDSMSTLAHELGHAYHSWVLRDRPYFLTDYPMNLAETASTFAEAVVADYQFERASSETAKLHMLETSLGDAVSFLMNIHSRFLFEDRFYRERATGEISAAEINRMMVSAQREAYLNNLADDGWYGNFWISKLHFYITGWPFYNFPYTFGYLLSLGIFSLGKESSDSFPEQYRTFLQATGSTTAEQSVADAFGYDLREPEFWNRCLDVIEGRVAQFVELTNNRVGTS